MKTYARRATVVAEASVHTTSLVITQRHLYKINFYTTVSGRYYIGRA